MLKIFLFLLSTSLFGEFNSPWQDLESGVKIFAKASYMQFIPKSSWIIGGTGAALTGGSFFLDQHFENTISHKVSPLESFVSKSGVALNLGIVPIFSNISGRLFNSEKLYHFSIEYFSTLYLALLESAVLSAIPVHERPESTNLDFWETHFRLKSSFPSGHVVPFYTLMFKTFQYYGPLYAIPPAILAVLGSAERVKSRKHYVSDIVGAAFVSLLSSEGTRLSSNYGHYHPWYKVILLPESLTLMPMPETAFGLMAQWNF